MSPRVPILCSLAIAAAIAAWLVGCGGDSSSAKKSPATPPAGAPTKPDMHEEHAGKHEETGHMEGEHKEGGHAHEKGHEHEKGHAQENGHGHAEHGSEAEMKAAAEKLASYHDAMHKIGELREQIHRLIEEGKLADVHPPAQHIAIIARRLPELAKKSNIPQEHWKDINTQSRDLANMFDEIDEAADADKKPETEAAFAKMIKLIDGLKQHAKHEGHTEGDEKPQPTREGQSRLPCIGANSRCSSGLFFGGAIDHVILAVMGSQQTPYLITVGVVGNWMLAPFDSLVTTGVRQVRAQARNQRIEVPFDNSVLDAAAIAERIGTAGYQTRVVSSTSDSGI